MSFIQEIFAQLEVAANLTVLEEIREAGKTSVSGTGLLGLVAQARTFLAAQGLKKRDRLGLLAPNSIRWVALDLAAMAEGLIVVPLYSRQAPSELIAMMKDCTPSLVCCGDAALQDSIAQNWAEAPKFALLDDVFSTAADDGKTKRDDAGYRSCHDHLYLGNVGRSQRCGADGSECGLHAGLHVRAAGAINAGPARANRTASFTTCRLTSARLGLRYLPSCSGEAEFP